MMKDTIGKEPLFYELIRVALGTRDSLSHSPSAEEWDALFVTSQEQAVAGVAFLALETLNKYEQKPQLPLLYEWIGLSEQIKQQNRLLNKRCVDITRHFENAGFRCCILKGQGNAQMYPEPLLRTSGDIDVWIEGDKDTIVNFVCSQYPDALDSGMHLDYPIFKDVDVEVHYKPQYLSRSKYNKRIQEFFSSESEAQFRNKITFKNGEGEICVPCSKFNLVLQLSHLLGHFYGEGIGLRQFVDLFYLLKNMKTEDRDNVEKIIARFGMERFTRGVMWIEKEILGLENELLVTDPSERIGRIVLSEIEKGGNFGKYNVRNEQRRKKGILTRAIMDSHRLIHLLRVQPSEALARLGDKLLNVESMKEVLKGSWTFSKYLFWPRCGTKNVKERI